MVSWGASDLLEAADMSVSPHITVAASHWSLYCEAAGQWWTVAGGAGWLLAGTEHS